MKPLFSHCGSCSCPERIEGFSLARNRNLHGLFGSEITASKVSSLVKKFLKGIESLKTNSRDEYEYMEDGEKVTDSVFLNTLCESWGGGEMSYPNFGGECRKFQFPDVRILADLFEKVGLDLRYHVLFCCF